MSHNLLSKKFVGGIYFVLGICAVLWDGIVVVVEHHHADLLSSLALFGIGLLLAGLGAERLGPMETLMTTTAETADRLVSIEARMAALKDKVRYHRLGTPGAIYEEAARLVKESSNRCDILATDLWPSPMTPTFQSYVQALANRIKQASKDKGAVNYCLVYARDPDKLYRARLEYRHAQVPSENFFPEHVDSPFPLEVLIVGSSVLIGFPNKDVGQPLRFAIAIDDVESAQELRAWYEDLLGAVKDRRPRLAGNKD